jgi:hypothetical protein
MAFVPFTRRDLLRRAAFGLAGGCMSGWLAPFASSLAAAPARKKSVIVLWMSGGPATIDLWDLKPGHANGGQFKEVATAAPGLKFSENLPQLAKLGKELAVVRSMTSKEGDHGRATFYARTGYNPQGAIKFPALGSVVAHELDHEGSDLPGFVTIAGRRFAASQGGGFFGPKFAPLVVGENAVGPLALKVPNLNPHRGVTPTAEADRLRLLETLEKKYAEGRGGSVADNIQSATTRAARLMRREAAAAFDLDQEKDKTREGYGRNLFGQGCLLARRLVERGVSCVEVTLEGWDTHQNNFERVKGLSGTLDTAYAALIADLKDRGRLDDTVILCMGEFGRTPKINGSSGRDHWPATWSVALAGGGIKGGQAVGKTSADGTTVAEKPQTVPNLIATVCKAVGLDPTKQNMSNVGRPIRLADPAAKPIKEIL